MTPRTRLVVGIGAGSGCDVDELDAALLIAAEIAPLALLATLDRRAGAAAVRAVAARHGVPILGFGAHALNRVRGTTHSARAQAAVGTGSVAEAAALLASGADELTLRRVVVGRVTVAAARCAR